MRLALFIIFSFSLLNTYSQEKEFYSLYNTFLNEYVSNGLVDYSGIKEAGQKDLKELTDIIASYQWTSKEEKAYLINAYNIMVISKVIDEYPVASPMDITNFFDKKDVILNGDKLSLNDLENKKLIPNYKDPRLHFALVCGAMGCPKIASEAYLPSSLEDQLENRTKSTLNGDDFVYQDGSQDATMISEIFVWYKNDFGGKDDSIFAFINKYRDEPFRTDFWLMTYNYDWTLNDLKAPEVTTDKVEEPDDFNIQTFTAGGLLGKGKFDFTAFNTLYTENKSNWLGQDFTGFRSTFVTHLFQFTYGITKSKRLNLGIDLNLRNSGRSVDSTIAGLAPAFSYSNTDTSRFGLTSVGIRLKWQPFKSVRNFSIQSTLSAPTIPNPEGTFISAGNPDNRFWADWNRIIWWNQFFFDKTYTKFQIFAEADLLFRFGYLPQQIQALDIPLNLFLSYFPTKKITVYAMSQHVPRLTYNIASQDPQVTDWVIPMNYTASGLGLKYAITSNLNLELLYTNFWRGKNTGLGSTFNIGIKYVQN